MKRGAAVAAAALLALASCRTVGPAAVPADPVLTARAVSAVLAARDEAWGPRRFKALFRGEVSPKVGMTVAGLPRPLLGRRDALLAGLRPARRAPGAPARLRRSGGEAGELFPGRLAAADVLSVLLGVPEESPSGEGAVVRGGRVELKLPSGDGRAVLVSPFGRGHGARPPVRRPRGVRARGPESRDGSR